MKVFVPQTQHNFGDLTQARPGKGIESHRPQPTEVVTQTRNLAGALSDPHSTLMDILRATFQLCNAIEVTQVAHRLETLPPQTSTIITTLRQLAQGLPLAENVTQMFCTDIAGRLNRIRFDNDSARGLLARLEKFLPRAKPKDRSLATGKDELKSQENV